MGDILIDGSQLFWQQGIRPRAGSKPGIDGKFADADQEVFIAACVGCIKAGPTLLGRDGKQQGVLVPIAIFHRTYEEVANEARRQMGISTQVAETKMLVES